MKKIDWLVKEVKSTCKARGHEMEEFSYDMDQYGYYAVSMCVKCGRTVHVMTSPRPNEIDMAGECLAVNCDSKRR